MFKYRVGATLDQDPPKFKVTGWVDPKKEAEVKEGFGKTVVFTDRVDWTDEKIVQTYFARSSMEEEFPILKDGLLMPVMPIFHRLDKRIRVHAFLCVVGLLYYRWIQRKVEVATGTRVPIAALAERLDRIQVVALIRKRSKQAKVVLQKLDTEQRAIVDSVALARFVPV